MVARPLLDTLEEHFAQRSSPRCLHTLEAQNGWRPATLIRLSEHLPTSVTVDLSSTSMPLYQPIDQVMRWTLPDSWGLQTLLPAGIRLHCSAQALCEDFVELGSASLEGISIFTDGSFGQGVSSWAFVVLGATAGKTSFLGWAAGRVPEDPKDPLFLCSCESHALSGEQSALLWAAIWAMQGPKGIPIKVFSDCLVALRQAQGIFGWSSGENLAPLCRAAFQALETAQPSFDPVIEHVRSHQGCPANELADALAKQAGNALCGHAQHQVWAAEWIRVGTLPWLWVQLEAIRSPAQWPRPVGSTLVDADRHTDSSCLSSEECHQVLGLNEPSVNGDPAQSVRVSLRLLSVNVQSLSDPLNTEEDPRPEQGFTGRARYLREQFTQLQVHVAALQEARSSDDATYVSDSHIRYCTARDKGGNFGCELWFSRLLPFVWRNHSVGHFHPNDFLAISSSPRDLIVRFSRAGVHILFVCVHAPVAGHKDRGPWWQALRCRLTKLKRNAEVVLIGDFNAGFPSPVHHRIGDLVGPVTHPPPADLHQILSEHDLWLPSTFSGCHVGPHETWISPTGTTGARLDYIAVPAAWRVSQDSSWVDFSLDWGQSRVDHYGICLDTFCIAKALKLGGHKVRNLDREAMASPEGRQTLLHICRTIPLQPWTSNVHRHYLAIERHLSQALAVAFPSPSGAYADLRISVTARGSSARGGFGSASRLPGSVPTDAWPRHRRP